MTAHFRQWPPSHKEPYGTAVTGTNSTMADPMRSRSTNPITPSRFRSAMQHSSLVYFAHTLQSRRARSTQSWFHGAQQQKPSCMHTRSWQNESSQPEVPCGKQQFEGGCEHVIPGQSPATSDQ